jgi:hypothetical protein
MQDNYVKIEFLKEIKDDLSAEIRHTHKLQ